MDKHMYLIEAIQAKAHLKKRWLFEAFGTVSRSTMEEYGKDPYPYQIFLLSRNGTELGFFDPASKGLVAFSQQTEPLLSFKDRIKIKPGDLANVKKEMDVTFGNVIVNAVIVANPFHDKIEFITGKIDPKVIEKQVVKRLKPAPKTMEERNNDDIYIDELIRYQHGLMYLDQFFALSTPSQSRKMHIPNPKVAALKNKLVKENKGNLDDLTVLADIESQLVALDKEEMKGDPAENVLLSGKLWNVCRKKKYGIYGLEEGFGKRTVITRALYEGFDPTLLPAYANAARSGSYNRGAQTAFGGVEVKRANRAFKAVHINDMDCGTKEGIPRLVTVPADTVGRYMIDTATKKPILITEELAKSLKGSVIFIRSPLLCKTTGLHFCKTCSGTKLSMLPSGVHIQVSMIGSILMNCFMKAMHGKALSTAKYDYRLRIR
jgi:hypothetical protein